MNAVEIEQAISELAEKPFDRQEFPFQFLEAFGFNETTIRHLRTPACNKSDLGGVLRTNDIHIATCDAGQNSATLAALRASAGSVPAGSPWVRGSRVPACGRHACAPQAVPPGRCGRALPGLSRPHRDHGTPQLRFTSQPSRSSRMCRRRSPNRRCSDDSSRNRLRRPDGWNVGAGLAGRCPLDGRRGAANTPSRSWQRSRRISLNRAPDVFFRASRAASRRPSPTPPRAPSASRSRPRAAPDAWLR